MAYANTIGILIAAKDEASAVIRGAAASATAATTEMNASNAALSKVGASLGAIGSTMTRDITLPIMAVGAVSAKMAYDFNNKMELLHTSAGIAQGAIAGLSNQVLAMSGEVGRAPTELADGLYHIASAGNGIWNTGQMMNILKVASEGANLGMANLGDTTYSLSSAMASGIKGAKDANDMMAILNATVGAGDMKMNDLNGALSTGILSTGATFGVSIQSIGAALATLTDNGEHADEAATRLRMTMALMTSPSGAAAKQLKALGLTAEDASTATAGMNKIFAESGLTTTKLADDLRQPNGIAVAMEDLKTHLENAGLSASETDAMLSKAFGGGRTDAALLTMLQNTGRMDDKFKAINESAGQFQQKLNDLNNTPQQKLRDAWSSIQASLVTIGGTLLPPIASAFSVVAQSVSNLLNWWKSLDPLVQDTFGTLTVALAATGPVLVGISKMISFTQDAKTGFNFLKDAGSGAFDLISKGAGGVAKVLSDLVGSAADAASGIGGKAAGAGSKWLSTAKDIASSWASNIASVTKTVIMEGPKIALHAVDASAAWILNAIRIGIVWTENMAVVAAKSTWASLQATPAALKTAAVWTASAATSSAAWVVKEMPRIVASWALATAQSAFLAAKSAAFWVAGAAASSTAWVVTEMPRIIASWVLATVQATIHAAQVSAAWVLSASTSAIAWVVTQLPRIIAGFVLMSGAAVANAAVVTGAFVGSAAASSAAFVALRALIATPLVMPAIIIGAAILAIQTVANKFTDLINQINDANASIKQSQSNTKSIIQAENDYKAGKITRDQELNLVKIYAHALGTNFAPGGLTMVGENGPELVNLPTGSKVATNKETQKMLHGGGDTNITITGNIQISSPEAATAFWDRIDKTQRLSRVGMAA